MTTPFCVVVVGNVGIDTNAHLPGTDINGDVEANFADNRDDITANNARTMGRTLAT